MTSEERPKMRQQQQKIHLLSDNILYREALDFIAEQGTIDGQTQMTSLLNYTQSWADLIDFVRHQSERDWIGRKTYYKQFYAALEAYLNTLRQRTLEEKDWFDEKPGPEATKADKRTWMDDHAILLAREFVQHLAAENLYREKVKK